jgi:hypothetical protein
MGHAQDGDMVSGCDRVATDGTLKNAGEQFVAVPLLLSINGGAVVDGEGILIELGVE